MCWKTGKKRSKSPKDKAKRRKRRKHKKRRKRRKQVDRQSPPQSEGSPSHESLVKLTETKPVEPVQESQTLLDAKTSPILITDDTIIDDTVQETNQLKSTSLRDSGCDPVQLMCSPDCDKTEKKKIPKATCSQNCPGRKKKESKAFMSSLSSRGCAKSCSRYNIIVCQPGRSTDDDEAPEMRERVCRLCDDRRSKVQNTLPYLERKTRKSIRKMKLFYKSLDVKRAQGFKCNLNQCDNTLLECSMGPCRNKSMLFNPAMTGVEEIEPRPTESTTVIEPAQDMCSQTSDIFVTIHCSLHTEDKSKKKRSKFNPFKKRKKKYGKCSKGATEEHALHATQLKNTEHDSREKLTDKRATKEDLIKSSVECKNHQICQCPTNPGIYSTKEGHALCCCPNESCEIGKSGKKK